MAEAIGLAAAITALLGTAKNVYDYLRDVQGADKEFAQLRVEVKSIEVILVAIDELVQALKDEVKRGLSPDEKWSATIRTLNANPDEGPIAQLRTLLDPI